MSSCNIAIIASHLSAIILASIEQSKSTGKEYSTQQGYFNVSFPCYETVITYLLMHTCCVCNDTTPSGLMSSQSCGTWRYAITITCNSLIVFI